MKCFFHAEARSTRRTAQKSVAATNAVAVSIERMFECTHPQLGAITAEDIGKVGFGIFKVGNRFIGHQSYARQL